MVPRKLVVVVVVFERAVGGLFKSKKHLRILVFLIIGALTFMIKREPLNSIVLLCDDPWHFTGLSLAVRFVGDLFI